MDNFTSAYITAALWSSTDDSGTPLDDNFTEDDIAPETLEKIENDCLRFQTAYSRLFTTENHRESRETSVEEFAGHDFWLTRNGHGAGFWDGDWTEPAATLMTEGSKTFGAFDLYIGDDGRLYA